MRRAWALALVAATAGCGESQRPPADDPSVVVPASTPSTVQAPQPELVQAAPAPVPPQETLESCVPRLRGGASLASKADAAQPQYDEAMRLEAAGDLMAARKAYFTIIQQQPASRYIPLVYLAFGESFAAEARNDPSKSELAKQAYREVTKYPPPDNQVYAYTTLRIGQLEAGDDPAKALASFRRVLETVRAFPSAPCTPLVTREAEKGLVESYAEAGRPDRAGAFLQSTAPDRLADLTVALARRYADRGQVAEAAEVLRLALEGGVGAPLCAASRELLSRPAISRSPAATALSTTVGSKCPR
jgi:tetratricopeptide (TPR) repeat protein